MKNEFHSNGKLLLTGEYTVLDGALALAVPTSFGQSLTVGEVEKPFLLWKSRDEKGTVWFESVFEMETLFSTGVESSGNSIKDILFKILREAVRISPSFLRGNKGYTVETSLDFPRDWGLGSSSTLINNIAQWAEIDAYVLLENTFSGSGYDIACAQHNSPIVYQLKVEKRIVREVDFDPPFREHLFFIHLDKKQNSREGISRYRKMEIDRAKLRNRVSKITEKALRCSSLSEFESLLEQHERLISKALRLAPVKESVFPDYPGVIKSLGAWGGDFVLATGNKNAPAYFKTKGYKTVIPYSKMVLQNSG